MSYTVSRMHRSWRWWILLLAACRSLPAPKQAPSAPTGVTLVFLVDVLRAGNTPDATVDAVRRTMERRLKSLRLAEAWDIGVAVPRVTVTLRGVPDLARARRLLTAPARLDFLRVDDEEDPVARLKAPLPAGVARRTEALNRSSGAITTSYLVAPRRRDLAQPLADLRELLAPERDVLLGPHDPDASQGGGATQWRTYHVVRRREKVGLGIRDAQVRIEDLTARPYIDLRMDDTGARWFDRLTAENVNRRLAIVVDGEVLSAPVIVGRIPGGRAMINLGRGPSFDRLLRDARDLARMLRAGALPTTVRIERENPVVGPGKGPF